MRYELDAEGYVLNVFWGCHSGNCKEYTGEVPTGYNNLNDWSENALINAYYIDNSGNLVLDRERKVELEVKIEQEIIDNTPLVHKDIYGSDAVLDSQYQKKTASGKFITIDNVQNIAPKVKITGIKGTKLDIYTQLHNLMRNDGKAETIGGVSFRRFNDTSIIANGTATEDIEYNISGSSTNTTPIFVLKKDMEYRKPSNYGVEMRYFDGETVSQVYAGTDSTITLPEDKEVTQVVIKIPKGTVLGQMLQVYLITNEYENLKYVTESYKSKVLSIDFSEYIKDILYPSNTVYPSNTLYPRKSTVDYILIQDKIIYISVNGKEHILGVGNLQLFNGYNSIYANEDANIEIEYSINVLDVELYNGLIRIDRKGQHFYESDGTEIGDIGLIEDENIRQIAFAINGETGTNRMVWGVKYDDTFIPVFWYEGNNTQEGTEVGGRFYIESPLIMQGKRIYLGNDLNSPNIVGDDLGNINVNADNIYINGAITTPEIYTQGIFSDDGFYRAIFSLDINYIGAYWNSKGIFITGEGQEGFSIYASSSDKNLKKNIKDTEVNALDLIKKIKHKQFDWKATNEHQDIGYIAQEMQEIDESFVHHNIFKDKEGKEKEDWQINILSVLATTTKALQEQQEEIEKLKEEINKLKEVK